MADPFAVAGSAVGVVSLGLSVCQGLISYYHDWQAYDSDLDGTGKNVGEPLDSLQVLETILRRLVPHNLDSAPNAAGSMLACRQAVETLQQSLQKCRHTPTPQNTKEKAKAILQRSLYPFRKTTLDGIRSDVSHFQNNLSIALQATEMELLLDLKQETAQSSTLTVRADQALDNLQVTMHSVDTRVQQIPIVQQKLQNISQTNDVQARSLVQADQKLEVIQGSVQAIDTSLSSCLRSIPTIEGSIGTIQTDGSRNVLSLERIEHREDEMLRLLRNMETRMNEEQEAYARPLAHLLGKPGHLKESCEHAAMARATLARRRGYCTCPRHERRGLWNKHASRIGIFSSTTFLHRRSCPLFDPEDEIRRHGLEIAWLPHAIRLSFESRRGAGGCSFAPVMTMLSFTRQSSPAFSIMNDIRQQIAANFGTWGREPVPDVSLQSIFEVGLNRLKIAFDKREATPTEILPDGSSMLHAAIECSRGMKNFSGIDNFMAFFASLAKQLVELGVPMNGVDNKGFTGCGLILSYIYSVYPGFRSEAKDHWYHNMEIVTESGGLLMGRVGTYELKNLRLLAPDSELAMQMADATNTGELSRAVINRSQRDVTRCLKISAGSIHERNTAGWTPLHFSATWTSGIRLLLDAGADPNVYDDDYGRTPLEYAALAGQSEPFTMLFEAGSKLEMSVHFESRDLPLETFQLLLKVLKDRRAYLQHLARENLPEELTTRLLPNDDAILNDRTARKVLEALENMGMKVRTATKVEASWYFVFEDDWIRDIFEDWDEAKADSAYDLGFFTPSIGDVYSTATHFGDDKEALQKAAHVLLLIFDKGSDLGSTKRKSFTAHEILADIFFSKAWIEEKHCSFCNALSWFVDVHGKKSQKMFPGLFEKFLQLELHDNCSCHCSEDGCNITSLMLKVSRLYQHRVFPDEDLISTLDLAQILSLILPKNDVAWRHISPALIRLGVFEALGLPHVCCFFNYTHRGAVRLLEFDPLEAQEIREEEADAIEDLEALVEEFQTRFSRDSLSIVDFMEGWMARRMEEYFNQKPEATPKERRCIQEIGVVLHE